MRHTQYAIFAVAMLVVCGSATVTIDAQDALASSATSDTMTTQQTAFATAIASDPHNDPVLNDMRKQSTGNSRR